MQRSTCSRTLPGFGSLLSFLMLAGPLGGAEVWSGIDVLQENGFQQLSGKRVGLITNQTGINRDGVPTIRILHEAPEVQLVALFSPEHGLEGKLDVARIQDGQDPGTGLKVFSLYGETRTPTDASLRELDALVFDIQDIGARFYTYISTMGNAMRAAANNQVEFVILDRPNPINGVDVAGPLLDAGRESFVAFHRLPVQHGMTVGELGQMFRDELQLDVRLTVVPVRGWRRADYFDRTGLYWVNPSPNMRSLTQAVLYPGIGLLETTNLSVGRGTDTPFEVIGAPWIDARRLAQALNASDLPGVRFVPIRFTPDSSKFAGELCEGLSIIVTNRERFLAVPTGLAIARQLRLFHRDDWQIDLYDRLLLSRRTWQAVRDGQPVSNIQAGYADELDQFKSHRQQWLIYP
jgi:uncharacterized protein YbbC (DUF1343 family)